MAKGISDRLLVDSITIRRSVQSFLPGTRKPVFGYQTVSTGIKARFNPAGTNMSRNVLGEMPRGSFRVFLNSTDLKENDEVVNEQTNKVYLATEVKDFFGHHLEAILEEKKS